MDTTQNPGLSLMESKVLDPCIYLFKDVYQMYKAILKIPRNAQRFLPLVKTEYYVFLKGQHKWVNLGRIIISKYLFIAENIIFLMVIAKNVKFLVCYKPTISWFFFINGIPFTSSSIRLLNRRDIQAIKTHQTINAHTSLSTAKLTLVVVRLPREYLSRNGSPQMHLRTGNRKCYSTTLSNVEVRGCSKSISLTRRGEERWGGGGSCEREEGFFSI